MGICRRECGACDFARGAAGVLNSSALNFFARAIGGVGGNSRPLGDLCR